MASTQTYFGRNILKEALAARVTILEIYVETKSAYEWLTKQAGFDPKQMKIIEGIPKNLKSETHQGVAFRTNHDSYLTFDASNIRDHKFVVLCNHIEDVHNLGSIIRCSAAFGASLIIHEEEKSASLTPAAVKASVGCAFKVSLMRVPHLEAALKIIKKSDFEVVGLDISSNSMPLYTWKPRPKVALVLGSEGFGIEDSVKSFCDRFIKIPMDSEVESLNVSHASSIAMSWIHQNRQ